MIWQLYLKRVPLSKLETVHSKNTTQKFYSHSTLTLKYSMAHAVWSDRLSDDYRDETSPSNK